MVKHSNVIFLDVTIITFVYLGVKFEFNISYVTEVMNMRGMMNQTGLG